MHLWPSCLKVEPCAAHSLIHCTPSYSLIVRALMNDVLAKWEENVEYWIASSDITHRSIYWLFVCLLQLVLFGSPLQPGIFDRVLPIVRFYPKSLVVFHNLFQNISAAKKEEEKPNKCRRTCIAAHNSAQQFELPYKFLSNFDYILSNTEMQRIMFESFQANISMGKYSLLQSQIS